MSSPERDESYRLHDLPGYQAWASKMLASGESEELIAHLTDSGGSVKPSDDDGVDEQFFDDCLMMLKASDRRFIKDCHEAMTEAEWLTCTDTSPMLKYIELWGSQRKLRLFACICCRRFWHKLNDQLRRALIVAERYADGEASKEQLAAANAEAIWPTPPPPSYTYYPAVFYATRADAVHGAWNSAFYTIYTNEGSEPIRSAAQCVLLRDIFGNPFRPVKVTPLWRTSRVVELATTIYEERTFKRMPELADALEIAGCTNADILLHCRGRGPHVRGCWVVDEILQKRKTLTENEWLQCDEPRLMLEFIHEQTSERKLRLLCCDCCRQMWDLIVDDRCRRAVEVAEQFADGRVSSEKLFAARATTRQVIRESEYMTRLTFLVMVGPTIWQAISSEPRYYRAALRASHFSYQAGYSTPGPDVTRKRQCGVLRDLAGNPFRPVIVDPAWLTPSVVNAAQSIYDDRAFDRMPLLADTLEKAGCDNADILGHCRQSGSHVRGCWVLDLVLGKE